MQYEESAPILSARYYLCYLAPSKLEHINSLAMALVLRLGSAGSSFVLSTHARMLYIYPLQAESPSLHAHALHIYTAHVRSLLLPSTPMNLCQCILLHCFIIICCTFHVPSHPLAMLNDPHPINLVPAIVLQCPHLLQMLDDSHIRIHETIHAVAHARFFATVESAGGDFRGDAFAEADVC